MLRVYETADHPAGVTLCDICRWRAKLIPEDGLPVIPAAVCERCGTGPR